MWAVIEWKWLSSNGCHDGNMRKVATVRHISNLTEKY
jgi:hypothetical protein